MIKVTCLYNPYVSFQLHQRSAAKRSKGIAFDKQLYVSVVAISGLLSLVLISVI